ncbi:microtubule-associated protein 10 [Otolemur garnettii]|uniref:Microtubule associated protein 10 n=1 Tax=Otolemur garnettii TaxID=30611 RepID=H0XWW1_OTOGA|nr:microtubule-associated protein 10 [Otolemur garnettii]
MAASLSERLFSLELLVDRVRLEARLLPASAVAGEQGQEDSSPLRALCPAVAFRLLDFPTLLVYPPDGPAAPAPEPWPGVISFGRGKSCLFRLHPATLHRLLLRTPLHTLLLQLPPGRPTPAPQLLGSCNISLAAAVQKVVGPAASRCSQGHRGSFPLHNRAGERIGHIMLAYRLTDLGSGLLGHLERPVTFTSTAGGVKHEEVLEAVEVSFQPPQEQQQPQQPASETSPKDTDRSPGELEIPKAQKDSKKIIFHSKANTGNSGFLENDKTSCVVTCPNAKGGRCFSPRDEEVTELDIETNTFCPPPLYYTHLTQEKPPPAQVKITIEPQVKLPEELDGAFPEKQCINSPTHRRSLKHTNFATDEGPPVLVNPPLIHDIGAVNQTTCHTQTEQNRINTIRQLPLLNALLVELSVLYDQPVASPTHIHPHLAWLYRAEDKKGSESFAKSTCGTESKENKLSVEDHEKSVSPQHKKKQVENPQKGKHFEKSSGTPQKRAPRGRLLYGLTNTLRLRLKQTNPDMLVVHEKREQYRKMQAQILGTKLRIPSSKIKILSFTEQSQKPHQLPEDKYLDSDVSFAENSDTSGQISRFFDEPSTTKEIKLKCATDKKRNDCGKSRTSNGSLGEIVSPAHSTISEMLTHTSVLGGEVEVQSPNVFLQDTVDRVLVDEEIDKGPGKTTDNDILTANENKASGNSCYENISELKYSDDFTSSCCSEDFCTTEDTNKSLQAHDSSPGAENPKPSQYTSTAGETRLFIRKNSSEKSFILSPPFSAGSPVHSYRKSRISKTQDKSLEEASCISTSDLSSSQWTEEKENQIDKNGMHTSKVIKSGQDIAIKLKTRTGCKSLEKSQSLQTSQVSSYLPSNLSELELNVLDNSTSDHFEDDDFGSLSISKQCKDICELVINKLPGYTV